ncbi:MAG: corrinoid protein [Acidimicrobiales bacterium]|nr:corrinoid protein [Acidimicrobiales bacterium]
MVDEQKRQEILQRLIDGVVNFEDEDVVKTSEEALSIGMDPYDAIMSGLSAGMEKVGELWDSGEYFVPEVLLSSDALYAGLDVLKPHVKLQAAGNNRYHVVIGTIQGDIHDIGKNLVGMMLEGAGFEVFDLGINTDVEEFLAALDEHKPDLLGMSALLTTTMPYMKVVIDTLIEKSLREEYTIIVGGAPLNEEFSEAIGADAYCRDAAVAAETAERLVAERRAAA